MYFVFERFCRQETGKNKSLISFYNSATLQKLEPVRGVNESQHASFLSSPQEKWYLFGNRVSSFTLMRKAVGHCVNAYRLHQTPFHETHFTPDTFYTRQLSQQTTFTPTNFYTCRILLHQPAFTPDTFYTNQLLHETPFTPTSFYTRHLLHQKPFHETPFTPDTLYTRHLLHEATFYTTHPFTPDTFYTRRLLHQTPFTSTDFTPHLSHQTHFTPSTFYTTPGRQTRVDSSLWPQRTVPKLPSGTNSCQTLRTATLNTSYFCQKRPLCQPPPSPTPPPNSHFVRKVKLRLAYRLAFVI